MQLLNNQYRVLKIINEDSFGSTYSVKDIFNSNRIKRLRTINYQKDTSNFIEYMKTHFLEHNNFNHPNITKFYYFNRILTVDRKSSIGNRFYYTYEDLNTENLFTYCKNHTFGEVLKLAVEICSAIKYAHLRGFLLCNIHPDEIGVVSNSDKPYISIF